MVNGEQLTVNCSMGLLVKWYGVSGVADLDGLGGVKCFFVQKSLVGGFVLGIREAGLNRLNLWCF